LYATAAAGSQNNKYQNIIIMYTLMLFFSLALLACGCRDTNSITKAHVSQPVHFSLPEVTSSVLTEDGLWLIDYAYDGERLSYAVITGPSKGAVYGHSGMGCDSNDKLWAYVNEPDGTKLSVWGSGRVFFFSGTNVVECSKHISGNAFKAFLDSNPPSYSMSNLLKFTKVKD
jgi:hypothetical protein